MQVVLTQHQDFHTNFCHTKCPVPGPPDNELIQSRQTPAVHVPATHNPATHCLPLIINTTLTLPSPSFPSLAADQVQSTQIHMPTSAPTSRALSPTRLREFYPKARPCNEPQLQDPLPQHAVPLPQRHDSRRKSHHVGIDKRATPPHTGAERSRPLSIYIYRAYR